MVEPVVKTVELACSAAHAFEVFVNQTSRWWPMGKHSVSSGTGEVAQRIVIEPHAGGAVYEVMFDGARSEWGKVTRFEADQALKMSWHSGSNSEMATEVEVQFEPLGEARCKVTLTHRGWEVWADKAQNMRDGFNGGWVVVFEEGFAKACV